VWDDCEELPQPKLQTFFSQNPLENDQIKEALIAT
jgi:hypothetical protein